MPDPIGFLVANLEPSGPDWDRAPLRVRRGYQVEAERIGAELYRAQLALGLDKTGKPMTRISRATFEAREKDIDPTTGHRPYSPMGRAAGKNPPLQSTAGKSRTQTLLRVQWQPGHGRDRGGLMFSWGFDAHSGQDWGQVLARHAAGFWAKFQGGYGWVPPRDVFGLSPAYLRGLQGRLATWWEAERRQLPAIPLEWDGSKNEGPKAIVRETPAAIQATRKPPTPKGRVVYVQGTQVVSAFPQAPKPAGAAKPGRQFKSK